MSEKSLIRVCETSLTFMSQALVAHEVRGPQAAERVPAGHCQRGPGLRPPGRRNPRGGTGATRVFAGSVTHAGDQVMDFLYEQRGSLHFVGLS